MGPLTPQGIEVLEVTKVSIMPEAFVPVHAELAFGR